MLTTTTRRWCLQASLSSSATSISAGSRSASRGPPNLAQHPFSPEPHLCSPADPMQRDLADMNFCDLRDTRFHQEALRLRLVSHGPSAVRPTHNSQPAAFAPHKADDPHRTPQEAIPALHSTLTRKHNRLEMVWEREHPGLAASSLQVHPRFFWRCSVQDFESMGLCVRVCC